MSTMKYNARKNFRALFFEKVRLFLIEFYKIRSFYSRFGY